MRKIVKEYEFWVSNISDRNVVVADLALTIGSRRHVNLLSKNYHYTLEQLEASAKNGSLYKKRDKLKVRQVAPEIMIKPGIYESKMPLFLTKQQLRSGIHVEDVQYEELQISEESFADELSEEE